MSQAKLVLGILGLISALAGIALNNRILIWVAIGLLGASIVARMIVGARARNDDPDSQRETGSGDPGATT